MSLRATAIVWEQSKADGTELLLMLAIADNANDSGEAFPGVPKLRRRIRVKTDRAVQKLIKKRVESGELIVEPRFVAPASGEPARQTSNLYSLIFRGLDNPHALKIYPLPPVLQDTGGASDGTPGGRPDGHRGGEQARTPHERSKEQSDKQSGEQSGAGGADAEAALNKLIGDIIAVWVTGWEGVVSGNPYSNKTNRADAKKLAQRTSLEDIKRYTLALKAPGKKWENARPSWGIWINDMGEWLKKNPAQPDEQAKETDPTEAELEQARKIAERQSKMFGGQK